MKRGKYEREMDEMEEVNYEIRGIINEEWGS